LQLRHCEVAGTANATRYYIKRSDETKSLQNRESVGVAIITAIIDRNHHRLLWEWHTALYVVGKGCRGYRSPSIFL
jgi:hypothetical protein